MNDQMGLTNSSVGSGASQELHSIVRQSPRDRIVALAGNPNVGKSTVFNALTGLHQHTGNWCGKTVANASGVCCTDVFRYILVDIPGAYSLFAHSAEEETARNFLCFDRPDAAVVVCDATCLERNLNLVLQLAEVVPRMVVCVNLLDEARRKGISVRIDLLSDALGVPVVGVIARKRRTLCALSTALDTLCIAENPAPPHTVRYDTALENAVAPLEALLRERFGDTLPARWTALRLLDGDAGLHEEIVRCLGLDPADDPAIAAALMQARESVDPDTAQRMVASALMRRAGEICSYAVTRTKKPYSGLDRTLDRFFTGRLTGYPVMLLGLLLIFYLTISLANIPSAYLSALFERMEIALGALLARTPLPPFWQSCLTDGVFRVLSSVVAVMLPPMAIFFPLFTLLEDCGYLPRAAYNLDCAFKRCHACGKQALTMCMGFGCNAAGVVGCRIIDSPRERLLAILTNSFVPCNGRFPALIALLTLFFAGQNGALLPSLLLCGVIMLGIGCTFAVTALLSATLLRGVPSAFTLEMPPYRAPQLGRVLIRSVLDRTLFVLGRAAAVAAPAGLVLYLLANWTVGGVSLLRLCADWLDPLGRLMGLDGVILIGFILGLPANEIVLPIILMIYSSGSALVDCSGLEALGEILRANGWTKTTALCAVLLILLHAPCSTTLLTIRKESGSWKWVALAALLPILCGILLCMAINGLSQLLTLIG